MLKLLRRGKLLVFCALLCLLLATAASAQAKLIAAAVKIAHILGAGVDRVFIGSFSGVGICCRVNFRHPVNGHRAKGNHPAVTAPSRPGYEVWIALSNITASDLESEGRVYGGGLKKIEPKELSYVKCPRLAELLA